MQKIVHILGSARCGTTLLDLILGSHPLCASLGELWLLGKRPCGLCEEECSRWKEYVETLEKPYYYKHAFRIFGADILIDSSKKWKWFLERKKKEKYDYKIIHLVRNGLDRLKFKKNQNSHIKPDDVMSWVNTYQKCDKLVTKHDGIEIKYEDLNTPGTIEKCCEYIGIDYQDDMKKFWIKEHHGLRGSMQTYSFVREYHGRIPKIESFVKEHGYNIAPRLGYSFLDKRDREVFEIYGGKKLNKRLGYEN